MNIDEASRCCLRGIPLDVNDVMHAIIADPGFIHSRSQLSGANILELAISQGNIELVSSLLLAGADPNTSHSTHDPPLTRAIRSTSPRKLEMVRLLIRHGAKVNAVGVLDPSPLHAAVAESSEELVNVLIEHGADVNIRNDADDCTPLFCAVMWQREYMVRLLLALGADHRLRNTTTGATPLDLAVQIGNQAIISALRSALRAGNPNVSGAEPT